MVTCAVPGCKSSKKNHKSPLSFHVFPADACIRRKWIRKLQRTGWIPKKYSVVCGRHFAQSCFSDGTEKRVTLRYGSIPTLFLPCNPKKNHTSTQFEDIRPAPFNGSIHTNCDNNLSEKIISKNNDVGDSEATMSEDAAAVHQDICEIKKEMSSECRTCLQTLNSDEESYYIFQTWAPLWAGVEDTIAESLQKIAQIQLSDMDPHSKVMCGGCCEKLHAAALFTSIVQQSDSALRQRYPTDSDTCIDNKWPKPIQIDKNVPYCDQMNIKEEELSDEEYNSTAEEASNVEAMEIKIEPVELLPQQEMLIKVNGHYDAMSPEEEAQEIPVNGEEKCPEHYNVMVKEEPVSDNETMATDLSLDCMLCAKVFNSVSGLKAHVIAQHSYKSVRRKGANESSPVKRQKHQHVCATCRRSFATSTDLMVHETCHNKSVCYGCNEKFDSFEKVMQHRLSCKAVKTKEHGPVKTLEDVQRPQRSSTASSVENSAEPLKCTLCGESFTDNYYMNIHLEIHHPSPVAPALNEGEMEVEALESLFSERA